MLIQANSHVKLSIIMALSQMEKKLHCQKYRPYQVRAVFKKLVQQKRIITHPVPTKTFL